MPVKTKLSANLFAAHRRPCSATLRYATPKRGNLPHLQRRHLAPRVRTRALPLPRHHHKHAARKRARAVVGGCARGRAGRRATHPTWPRAADITPWPFSACVRVACHTRHVPPGCARRGFVRLRTKTWPRPSARAWTAPGRRSTLCVDKHSASATWPAWPQHVHFLTALINAVAAATSAGAVALCPNGTRSEHLFQQRKKQAEKMEKNRFSCQDCRASFRRTVAPLLVVPAPRALSLRSDCEPALDRSRTAIAPSPPPSRGILRPCPPAQAPRVRAPSVAAR